MWLLLAWYQHKNQNTLLLYASVSLMFCFGLVIFKKLNPNISTLSNCRDIQRISIIPLLLLPGNFITSQ